MSVNRVLLQEQTHQSSWNVVLIVRLIEKYVLTILSVKGSVLKEAILGDAVLGAQLHNRKLSFLSRHTINTHLLPELGSNLVATLANLESNYLPTSLRESDLRLVQHELT